MTPQKIVMITFSIFILLNLNAQDKNQEFWKAAKNNDVELLKNLIDEGIDVNTTTEYGATALMYAADKGNLEAVNLLLENGADPNLKDLFYESSPYLWISYTGNVEMIKSMIKHGADISNPMPVYWAAGSDQTESVRVMLENGAPGADRVLSIAIRNQNIDMLKMVLEVSKFDEQTLSAALISAQGTENKEMIDILTKEGAKMPDLIINEDIDKYCGSFKNTQGQSVKLLNKSGNLNFSN